MEPIRPGHTPPDRDRAIRRLHRITASVAVGGAAAVGVVGWGLAAAGASASTSATTTSTTQTTTSTTTSTATPSPTSSQTVTPAPTSSPAHAISGGSGRG